MSPIRILVFALIPVIVPLVIILCLKSHRPQKGLICLPRGFAIIGAIGAVFFAIPTLITLLSDQPLWIPLAFFSLVLLSLSLIMIYRNCRITYDEIGFTHKNFFGIKRSYTYDQVTAFERRTQTHCYIHVGKRKISVDTQNMIGGEHFILLVPRKYRELHDHRPIPVVPKKKDFFNGHLDHPVVSLICCIAGIVIWVGLAAFLTCYACLPDSEKNTSPYHTQLVSCEQKGSALILRSEDGQVYRIDAALKGFDSTAIRALCDGATEVTVFGKAYSDGDDGSDFVKVSAIRQGDLEILSFKDSTRLEFREALLPLLAFYALTVIMIGYIILTMITARYPERFSKRLLWILFRGKLNV